MLLAASSIDKPRDVFLNLIGFSSDQDDPACISPPPGNE
jgi:hypothetical protein